MDVLCATCGCDLTVARENWDNASILRPLVSVEVLPCSTCLSRAAEMAAAEQRANDAESDYLTRQFEEGEKHE